MPSNKIILSEDDIARCWEFSNKIICSKNQYDRMMKNGLSDSDRLLYRIKRTFAGKAGEMAFYRFLEQNGKVPGNSDEMFEIYTGTTNVDSFDFRTSANKTVDIKTAVFANHKRLLVPLDQFNDIPKDYYVGIKLKLPDNVVDYGDSFTPQCIKDAYICGFTTHERLKSSENMNFGEYYCKAESLSDLSDISELIAMFDDIR